MKQPTLRARAAVALLCLVTAGCTRDDAGVAPTAQPALGVIPDVSASVKFGVPEPERFEVCNGAPYPGDIQLATLPVITLDVRIIGATSYPPFSLQLARGQCRDIWLNGGTAEVVVVTQRPVPGFPTVFVRQVFKRSTYTRQAPALGDFTAARVSGTEGALVYFGYAALSRGMAVNLPNQVVDVPKPRWFHVCNGDPYFPGPPTWPAITVDVAIDGASPPQQFQVVVPPETCKAIWLNEATVSDILTVTQQPIPGLRTSFTETIILPGGLTFLREGGNHVTGPVSRTAGTLVTFFNF